MSPSVPTRSNVSYLRSRKVRNTVRIFPLAAGEDTRAPNQSVKGSGANSGRLRSEATPASHLEIVANGAA